LWPRPENLTSEIPPEWWSERHWKLLEQAGRTLRNYGDNYIKTPLIGGSVDDVSLVQIFVDKKGLYEFDFSRFDKWVELFLKVGYEKIEGSHLGPGHDLTPLTVNATEKSSGKSKVLFTPASPLDEWLDFLDIFYGHLFAHLQEKGWADIYVQHLMDEPHKVKEYARMEKGFRTNMPGIPNMDAIQNIAYSDYVDVQVFNLQTIVKNQETVKKRKQQGKAVWHYQCCSPYPPYPNRWLDRALFNSRLYPWLGYILHSEGYLFWAANGYRGADPYKSSIGPLPAGVAGPEPSQNPGHPVGDNWLYYPGPEGLRGSMRTVAFREGLTDHTLLTMLAEKDPARADSIMNKIARSTKDYSSDPVDYHAARKDLLEALR
jgi:hypothetical protein